MGAAATAQAVGAFHRRWYRPENTVIVVVGDVDPKILAALTEKWFGDWRVEGRRVSAPDFGDPVAPRGARRANPVGETGVLVEPDLPRNYTYAIMRPWRQKQDTIAYNQGLMVDAVAQSIINRRLESRARAGGSYLYAQVTQDDVSRSTDATFVTFAPLTQDWQSALADVRAVIADALVAPPTQEEIDREVAEIDVAFASAVEQRSVMAGSRLADDVVQAVDIRETVASPETVLEVFRDTKPKFTPRTVLERTRKLFSGDVIRSVYVTPAIGEASAEALRTAMLAPVEADGSARLAAREISFAELPPVGEPGAVVSSEPLGVLGIERVDFGNGVTALLWANDAEPGRVAVKVRFGAGYRAFGPDDAVYVALGKMALVGSGVGELGQEELDRISTGRRMGFDFAISDAVFTFAAQTRQADLADQLYLFAAKLGMPGWDANPVLRARAASKLAYESYSASPGGVLGRDLEWLMRARDGRFATPDPAALDTATPEGFRAVWEPLLAQGPVEVLIFLTWQSRRVLLEPEQDENGNLIVRRSAALAGYSFPDGMEIHTKETMQAFAKSKDGRIFSVGFSESRDLWRNSLSLLRAVDVAEGARPRMLDWISQLRGQGLIGRDRLPVDFCGLAAEKAKLLFWNHERFDLPLVFLENDELVHKLGICLDFSEEVGAALRFGVKTLADALETQRETFSTEANYWAWMEVRFHRLLGELPVKGDEEMIAWFRDTQRIALDAFNQTVMSLSGSAAENKAAVAAENAMRSSINKAIKSNATLWAPYLPEKFYATGGNQ
ncbi:type I-E CRISPR-associated protein Cse1/CasA [Leptolyngbya sp. 15MV]|nr:type I-E CRISPR-associated protein Cse1/CasA [Leptolyngbya sp. 15MV]